MNIQNKYFHLYYFLCKIFTLNINEYFFIWNEYRIFCILVSILIYTRRDIENPCSEFAALEKQRLEAIHFQETTDTGTEERVVVAQGNKIDIKSRSKRKSAGDYYEGIVRKSKKDSLRDKRKSARVTIMTEAELVSEKIEAKPVRIRPLSMPSGPELSKDELSEVFDKMRGKKRDITAPRFQSEAERHGLEGAGRELMDVLSVRTKKFEVREQAEPAPE